MARRSIVERPRARLDVVGHYVYLALENEAAADRFLAAVESTYRLLAERPGIGREYLTALPQLEGIRVWPVQSFHSMLIFYRTASKARLEIVRVLHGASDIDSILSDE